MEKKQSSVDWFYQRILAKDIESVFEQAKAMHKDEIKDAVNSCGYQDEAEYYYNETFGGEKQC